MPLFAYKGIDSAGKTVSGEMDAAERRSAVRKLSALGIKAIAVNPLAGDEATVHPEAGPASESDEKPKKSLLRLRKRQSKSAQALSFLQKLLVLLSAGLPLGDALRLLSLRLSDPVLRDLSQVLWRKLSEGSTLAGAMRDIPGQFNESTIHLVEAGEASGNLVPILERVVAYMEESAELKKKILSSLAYPVFVCFIAFGVVALFLFFLLPRIRGMLETLGGDLAWFTSLLVNASDAALKYGPFMVGALFIGWWALMQWRKKPQGRAKTDQWMLNLPFLGTIYLYSNLVQTSNLMATLMGSGVNTTETLRLVERTINNTVLRGKFANARKQIQEGVNMATAIKRVRYMPDLAMDILTVGENTGNLVNSLRDINRIYRAELQQSLGALTMTISTGALIFAFLLVGLIAMSILLSVFQISNALAA